MTKTAEIIIGTVVGFVVALAGFRWYDNRQQSSFSPTLNTTADVELAPSGFMNVRQNIYNGCMGQGGTDAYCSCAADYMIGNFTYEQIANWDAARYVPEEVVDGILFACAS